MLEGVILTSTCVSEGLEGSQVPKTNSEKKLRHHRIDSPRHFQHHRSRHIIHGDSWASPWQNMDRSDRAIRPAPLGWLEIFNWTGPVQVSTLSGAVAPVGNSAVDPQNGYPPPWWSPWDSHASKRGSEPWGRHGWWSRVDDWMKRPNCQAVFWLFIWNRSPLLPVLLVIHIRNHQ